MTTKRHSDTVFILNATNIGSVLDGIGVYTLSLLREFSRLNRRRRMIVYVNRSCTEHLRDIDLADRCEVRWVSALMSPDRGFSGHLLRLLFSNYLALKYRKSLYVVTSQMEAVFTRRNVVMTVHDIIPLLFKQFHRKQYFYFKYLIGFAMRLAARLITPSIHTKEMLQRHYQIPSQKIHVIHNGGGNAGIQSPVLRSFAEEEYILYAGRVVDIKNVSGVIQAFSRIADCISHKLIIVGEGAHRSRIEPTSFGVLRLSDRIIFKGHIPSEQMAGLLRGASLFVFPSFYEGFGLPPLEAMGCGCPVVTSAAGSLPEVCGDAAFYVDPHDIASIASGIQTVLTNNELRASLVRKGIERVRLFNWKASASEHLTLFDDVVRGAAGTWSAERSGVIPYAPRREIHVLGHGIS